MNVIFVYKKKKDKKKISIELGSSNAFMNIVTIVRAELNSPELNAILGSVQDFKYRWKLSHIKLGKTKYSLKEFSVLLEQGAIEELRPDVMIVHNVRYLIPPRNTIRLEGDN